MALNLIGLDSIYAGADWETNREAVRRVYREARVHTPIHTHICPHHTSNCTHFRHTSEGLMTEDQRLQPQAESWVVRRSGGGRERGEAWGGGAPFKVHKEGGNITTYT